MDVRALFPLTLRHLGDATRPAPTAAAFVQAVCDAHAKGDIPHRAARDLVRYEAALTELRPRAPQTEPLPPEGAPLLLSPDVRVIVYGAGLPEMLASLRAGGTAKPRPARGWLVLWRDQARVHERVLPREEGWLLESFREPTPWKEAVEDDEDRALVEKLWREGVLVRPA